MTEITGQNKLSTNSILVRDTKIGIESGKLKGFTPKGELLVETSKPSLQVWSSTGAKTVEQAILDERRKNNILAKFASIQHQIIGKLTSTQAGKNATTITEQKSLNLQA